MINKAKIVEAIKKLSNDDAIELWNSYCCEVDGSGDYIYQMDEFNDIITASNMKPLEIAKACYGYCGSFCPTDDYFWFEYGYLKSCIFPMHDNSESPFCTDAIADYIVDNNDSLHCNEIRKILDENNEGGIEA